MCLDITRDVMLMQQQKMSAAKIREAIDARYGGRGPGMPTPRPPGR